MSVDSENESDKNFKQMINLLILLARQSGVSGKDIAKAMGCSEGRISQMLDRKKYGKKV